MSTVSDTVAILETFIKASVTGSTVSPRYEAKIEAADLPTFIILPQGATREHESFRNFHTSRDYIIVMLIALVADDKPQAQQVAREAGYIYLDTVPDYFAKYPMLNDLTTGIIADSTLPRENGVQLTSWAGDQFTGIEFRITITTSKQVS